MTNRLFQPTFAQDLQITDQDWHKIEEAGGVSLNPTLKKQLLAFMQGYRDRAAMTAASLAPGDVRAPLQKLAAALTAAQAALAAILSPEADGAERHLRYTIVRKRRVYERDAVGDFAGVVATWGQDVHDAIAALHVGPLPKESDGAAANLAVGTLGVFHEAGGKGDYSKGALNFVQATFEFAGFRVQSRNALIQLIKRSLSQASANSKTIST